MISYSQIPAPDGREDQPLFSFGVIADVQYADVAPAGNRFYNSAAEKLKEAYKTFGSNKVDFVVNLGDLIDRDFASFKTVIDIANGSGLKTLHVAGNHDFAVHQRFKKQLPVLDGKGYYSVTYNNFRFVLLNGNEISTYASVRESEIEEARKYLDAIKASGGKNAMDWNGAISRKQLRWLGKQLDIAAGKRQKVFIMCHFPVFPEDVHNLLNYKDILQILGTRENVIAWFAGHNHAGNYGQLNKTHFLTFRGMVETAGSTSYAIVDVYADKIRVRGFGREETRILAF